MTKFCTKCGSSANQDANFCSGCGGIFPTTPSPPNLPSTQVQTSTVPGPSGKKGNSAKIIVLAVVSLVVLLVVPIGTVYVAYRIAKKTVGTAAHESNPTSAPGTAQQQSTDSTSAQGGLSQLAQGLSQLGAAAGEISKNSSGNPVEPVDFRKLVALLPEVPGWRKGEPEGEHMKSPVSFSEAKCAYTKGRTSIEASVTDSGLNQMLVAPFLAMLSGSNREGTFGYERVTNTGGNLTYEKWDKNEQSAEFMVVVNRRFIWYLKGSGVTDPNVLQEVASKIDLRTLSSMH